MNRKGLNSHADKSSQARGLKVGLSLHLHPYLVYFSLPNIAFVALYNKTCFKRPLKRKTKSWVSRPIIIECRSKVLQNAPREHSAIFQPSLSNNLSLRPLFCLFLGAT